PSESVVDERGRVHGMHGLYVVDGSVLPRSSRVNPSLTIYAWGLRVGDLVAKEFRREMALATQEPKVEGSLRQSHVALVSSSTTHLGDAALGWQDALIARDPDGHTTIISGAPVQQGRTTSQE